MANTLKFGSGIWATKEGSTLAYNDENGNYKPLPFEFERDTNATVVNKKGLIETVGSNIPRIDFQGNNKGALLLEPERTNLIPYSEDLRNASWLKSGLSSVPSGFISPDGSANAYGITDDTSNSIHRLRDSLTLTATTDYTLSVFAKKGTLSNIQLALINTVNSNTASRVFDLENGILGESITGASGTLSDSKIIDYGNGWYRCEITAQLTTAPNTYQITLATQSTNNSISGNQVTYDGDGNGNVYLWGAQLEQGSYPTSYIPTSGGTVTRVEDTCNNAGNDQVINSTEGVLYAEINAFDSISRISLSDGSSSNRVSFRMDANSINFQYRVGGSYSYRVGVDIDTSNTNKIAMSFNNGVFVGYLNGVSIGSPISGASLGQGVLDRLNFNDGNSSDSFEGNIKDLRLYNTALTDQELQALTTI